MPSRIAWFVVAGLVFLAASLLAAETSIEPPEAASEYTRAKQLLLEGNWAEAATIFEALAGEYPDSPSLPLFIFHRAKANYYAGDHSKAAAGFSLFLSRFPDAPETPYANFYLGNAYYNRGDIERSLQQYLLAYAASTDDRLTDLVHGSITALLSSAGPGLIAANDLDTLPDDRRCRLIGDVAPILAANDETVAANDLLATCDEDLLLENDHGPEVARNDRAVKIAILLPLTGDLQEFGNEIYNGAVVAIQVHSEESDREIALVTYDTEGYPIDAARVIGELDRSSIVAAIGPLTSEAAAVASARLHSADLPLIIPAATDAGLTRLSETSFQLSPNIELEAVQMADYAIDVLKASTAVVIAPTTAEHVRMAERFTDYFEQRGGQVVAGAYYPERDSDLGEYLRDIKQAIRGAIPDSAIYLNENGDTVEADGASANVDVIYLPGQPEQIRQLLPQMRFYNLRGRLLGSDGWGSEEIYRLGDDVTQEAIFPSPFLPVEPNGESVRFAAAYDTRYGGQPGRLARLGYDAVRLIVQAVELTGPSREDIVNALKGVRDYPGASGLITFGDHRENIHMPLYRIVDGAPVPLNPEPGESQ